MKTMRSRTGLPILSKRGRWSRLEQTRLRQLWGLRDDAVIARELRRSVPAVLRMAGNLFPRATPRTGPWTAAETLELKRYLGATSSEVIARILGRNREDVQARILDLGRIQSGGSWTRAEIVEFKRIYGRRTDEDLARIFGRSLADVRELAQQHRLAKDKAFVRRLNGAPSTRMPRWRADELYVLRKGYAVLSNMELARRLGRSVKSVLSKAHQLHLRKSSARLCEMGRANVSARYLMSS